MTLTPVQMVYATVRLTVRCLLDNRIVDIVYLVNLKLLQNFSRRLPVRNLEDFLQIQIELLA